MVFNLTYRICILFNLLCLAFTANGQSPFNNGSFEDDPSDATTPHGWYECEALTTPDIFPGVWGVYGEASDGNTYMGLITRPNNTWESIGQRLVKPLESNNCYTFSIDLAHAKTYAGYNQPLRLRIWAGSSKCQKGKMIFESDLIEHADWKTYIIKFNSEEKYTHIILEAYHNESPIIYKGNILLDHLTSIRLCGRA